MKNCKNSSLTVKTVLFIFFSMNLNIGLANHFEPDTDLQKSQGEHFSMNLKYDQPTDLKLSFEDEWQFILWDEEISGIERYQKNYDLSLLPDGVYFFEVEDQNNIREWEIQINQGISLINEKREIAIPKFIQNENLVKISFDSQEKFDVEIIIHDEAGLELYREDFIPGGEFDKVFDFSKVEPGIYYIQTKVGSKDFNFLVNM